MFKALARAFDYSGRSTRWEYWSYLIGFAIVLMVAGAWVANYQDTHLGLDPQFRDDDAAGIGFAVILFLVLPHLSLKVRRYHDFGWSGWAVLWTFVPVANLIMELMLLFRGPALEETVAPVAATPEEPRHITIYNSPHATAADTVNAQSVHFHQIEKLADLHTRGLLTADEYATAKAKILLK